MGKMRTRISIAKIPATAKAAMTSVLFATFQTQSVLRSSIGSIITTCIPIRRNPALEPIKSITWMMNGRFVKSRGKE
jgi:hypothetical protein